LDIIPIASDFHANSTVGLCPPIVNLDDGGTYKASRGQRWLWECWLDYTAKVKAAANGAPISAFINGDAVEADSKKRSTQLITRNKSTILSMATETLAPLIDIATRVFFMRGTDAHVGKSAEMEEELAKDCTITEPYSDSISSWWTFYGEFSGVYFDISHHGRMGGLPWSKTNPLGPLAVRLMMAYAGRKLDVAVRSHNHKYGTTADNYPVMVTAAPAWQLATEYSNRQGFVEPADIGGLIFTCDKGAYTWRKVTYPPAPAKAWSLQKRTSSPK
jgi:hypothetical protein